MAWANWNTAYSYAFNEYSDADTYNLQAWSNIGKAQGHVYNIPPGEVKNCCQDLVDACNRLYNGIECLLTYKAGEVPAYTTLWMMKNTQEGEGDGVDMNAILSAMWSSANTQTLLFIAYIDAMRGSISEKTVTQQSMADYLRHFL